MICDKVRQDTIIAERDKEEDQMTIKNQGKENDKNENADRDADKMKIKTKTGWYQMRCGTVKTPSKKR